MAIATVPAGLAWKNATGDDLVLLDQLQPNIVKAHVREHMDILLLRFDTAAAGKAFLKKLSTTPNLMKSARAHLIEVEKHHLNPLSVGTAYVGVGLTAAGYSAIGIAPGSQPSDASFQAGMRSAATRSKLKDPPLAKLESTYKGDLHCIVLIGDLTPASVAAVGSQVRALLGAGVTLVGTESGLAQRNANGEGIEHFGYVDGRSQPLFLAEDVHVERLASTGIAAWDPAFSLARVVVADKAAPQPTKHFGSYFVFRKLEQNVQAFKLSEEKLATNLGLGGTDKERAGALIVGRFEDGTPVSMQRADGLRNPVTNNFNYADDPDGMKCPFPGHVRKVNTRGSGGFEPVDAERRHIMARRGQTYGARPDNPNDGQTANKPTKNVGLLFMAFNANIAEQFEFAQATWANNPQFPKTPSGQPAGVDMVIAQGTRPAKVTCPVTWGGNAGDVKHVGTVPQAVTMKGGDYFFMPSLAFLRAL